jgi:hypothetical protein
MYFITAVNQSFQLQLFDLNTKKTLVRQRKFLRSISLNMHSSALTDLPHMRYKDLLW